MNKISKILSLIICGSLVLGMLASCGNKSDDSNADDSVESSSSTISQNDSNDSQTGNNNTSDSSKSGTSSKSDSNGTSGDDDLEGITGSVLSINTLSDPNATPEDKAFVLKTYLSNAALQGGIVSGNVPGGEKIKDKLNQNISSGSTNDKNNSNNANTGDNKNPNNSNDNSQADKPSKDEVKLTGNEKTFVITVYPKIAPKTSQNFVKLVDEGFYNGMEFNRVIENFLAQAGDTDGNGSGTSGKTIAGEFKNNGYDNTLSHLKGVVSMNRNPDDPNSATSQFFICYNDECKFMDGNYAAFGRVTEGMNVVEDFQKIESQTGSDGTKSKPVSPISIKLADNIGADSNGNPQIKFYVTY